jgi:hypothetical protein
MRTALLPWTTLVAIGTTHRFCPATPFMTAAEARQLQARFEVEWIESGMNVVFAYQVANADMTPIAVYELGTALTAAGVHVGTLTDVTNNTGSKLLVRFGWAVWKSDGQSPHLFARAGGAVAYAAC